MSEQKLCDPITEFVRQMVADPGYRLRHFPRQFLGGRAHCQDCGHFISDDRMMVARDTGEALCGCCAGGDPLDQWE